MKLKDKISNSVNLNGGNINKYIDDSTNLILKSIEKPNKIDIDKINIKDIKIGNFYFIKYNYNGNRIWIPIFSLNPPSRKEYTPEVLYCINISHMNYKLRILFFNMIFESFNSIILDNEKLSIAKNEKSLNKITFDFVYQLLSKNVDDLTYCLTGFNILKIEECYLISTNFVYRFIMTNFNKFNTKNIKIVYDSLSESVEKIKIQKLLEEYENIINTYKEDSDDYYKQLKKLEKYFKLFE